MLQAYFEATFSSRFKEVELSGATVADYSALYPLLGNFGVPAITPLSRMVAYSTQMLPGVFILPDNSKIEFAIETWGISPQTGPAIVELSFDGAGYSTTAEDLQALEEFFTTVVMQEMRSYALPDASLFMGSKLQVLRHLVGTK